MKEKQRKVLSPMARINRMGYTFILPFFVFYIVFNLYPIFYSLFLSFHTWDGLTPKVFVGFANYIKLFTSDSYFWKSIGNTMIIMIVYIPVTVVAGLLISTLLYNKAVKKANVFQTIQFLPYIIAPVCVGMLFTLLFDWSGGMVNQLLVKAGVLKDGINWLGDPTYARMVLMFLNVWTKLGYVVTLFLAGMTNISPDVLEAAEVDGANYMQKLFNIIIPLLRPIMLFVVLTSVIEGLQMFDAPQVLFNSGQSVSAIGGPGRSCLTAIWYMQDTAFGGTTGRIEMGYGSTIAYGLFMVIAAFSVINFLVIGGGKEDK